MYNSIHNKINNTNMILHKNHNEYILSDINIKLNKIIEQNDQLNYNILSLNKNILRLIKQNENRYLDGLDDLEI